MSDVAASVESGRPRETLGVSDGVAIVVGIVIGSAIFETPSLVAANVGSGAALIGVWIAGAFVSLLGALCWAELASRYPDAGGDYHFLTRAWGRDLGFLYAWSRMAVIQSGSIALIAFVFGDYASQIVRLGNASAAIWAGAAVAVLTLLHLAGVGASKRGQRWLSVIQIGGIALLVLGGWLASSGGAAPAPRPSATAAGGSIGLAMVFVLLTYGGWNEAAFISAELRNPRKSVLRVLLASVATIAALYVLVNLAMLRTLGIGGMAASEAIGADLMRRAAGAKGATLVSLLVVACTLASINAMIFTGARTNYAMGRDFRMFSRLGLWRSGGDVPRNALLVQGAIILCLIAFGGAARNGFQAMVEYSAPVFWLFLLLATLSLLRLRQIEPARPREFSVPLYPVTPILFAAICAYLLYSSVRYTGAGALAGLAIVAVGAIVLLFERRRPAGRGNG